MEACLAADAASGPEELDSATVSRLLTGSRAVPFAVVRMGRFVFANPAFKTLFRAGAGVVGMPLIGLIAARDRTGIGELLADLDEMPMTFRGQALRRDGTVFDVELFLARETFDGMPTICVFGEDVTSRRLSEQHLSDLAYTDMLTGLPNRARVLDRLRDAIVEARGGGSGLAVLMADLDGLKRANDTYGHQAGDAVLQVTAQRFLGCIRDRDTLARLGGDEFCAVVPRLRDGRDAAVIAARLVEAALPPIPINGWDVCVGVSVGIALFPDHGSSPDELIAAADAALYEAKRGGRSRFVTASARAAPAAIPLPMIIWSASHEVGIAVIDRQHRKLTEHLNTLFAALGRGDEPAVISDILASTIAYTQHHFETEDRLMETHGFAGAAAHRAVHAHLLNDLRNFSAGCDRRSLSLTTRFLVEWLLRHIDSADRGLATALRACGVQ